MKMHTIATRSLIAAVLFASVATWRGTSISAQSGPARTSQSPSDRMSAMGHAASRKRKIVEAAARISANSLNKPDSCVNQPDCGDDTVPDGLQSTQSETSIAVDATGQHVVIAFNDFRGFNTNPLSISGFMYSDDGGTTFVDGGQLPSPGDDMIGATRFPMVFGDPDVKYVGACTFVYSSIIVKKSSDTTTAQTLGVHRSTDCGHTWVGPFEVTPATNPNGPQDAADKEFLDVDAASGRVILSWSNFTSGGVEISTTYSDDIATATPPMWSARQIVAATVVDGQASIPRFAGDGSTKAYVAWSRFTSGFTNNIGFARSTDSGATWSAPQSIAPVNFFTMDYVLGNDRVNSSPSLAVDKSYTPFRGNIYVVYATNANHDGADIAFQRSTDEGVTFSTPILLNSRPGDDRAQWFPWVTVDSTTGRLHVFYYDQAIASSGDLTEVSYTFSDDGGDKWSPPQPLTVRPFKAGWGNDGSEPNLGDYIQAVAQSGDLFAAYALASRPPAGFADGQPDWVSLTVPDVAFSRVDRFGDDRAHDRRVPLSLGKVTFNESGGDGFINPGDRVRLEIPLYNYVTNPLNAAILDDVTADLSTTTPGVSIVRGTARYGRIRPGDTAITRRAFVLEIDPTFVAGTPIELTLRARGEGHRPATLLHTLFTGTPDPTTLLSEDFSGVLPGDLPQGWLAVHGGGGNVVPWTTTNTFCGTTANAAFHQNAADGGTANSRWERLFSPVFEVPADAEYVTLDMDVCYDTEDDPNFNVLAYDGFFLRITDLTPGRMLRSVLAEAFEDEFTTDGFLHYPKHFPRSSDPNYFPDMSAWAGDSQGLRHVHLRLPGMAGSTVQLRFEYTQDVIGTCADVRPGHTCGVSFNNLVVSSVRSVVP